MNSWPVTEDKRRSEQLSHDTGLKKSLEQYPSIRKFFLWIELIGFFNRFIRYLTWLGLAYLGYLSIDALAGETTYLEVFNSVTVELLSKSLPWWAVTTVFALWAILERSLRKRKTKKLTKRIERLETKLDPQRTSSGLVSTGDTHPNDERSEG